MIASRESYGEKEKPSMNLQELHNLQNDPYNYAMRYKKESGKKVVGYFCSYTPEELIFAAAAAPFRIFATQGNINLADTHLQAYCCSPVRGALEEALSGSLNFLDGVVFPHTCDSIQRLSDIWRLNVPLPFHIDVVLPVKLNSESAREYMIDVLHKFKKDLEKNLNVEITEDSLRHAISLYNKIRESIKTILDMRQINPSLLKGSDFYSIVKASMIMERNTFFGILSEIVHDLEEKKETPDVTLGKRLVLTGAMCNHPDFYQIIEDCGGMVVWDDLCTGSRCFEGQLDPTGDPIVSIAERYLRRIECPAKHSGLSTRAEDLLKIVQTKNADGVIFLMQKFCDPHSFDYPYLKKHLDNEGISNTLIEMENQASIGERLKTRFEAFLEML
jgi:bzd-type benzoyl-CoA reductase N subunit